MRREAPRPIAGAVQAFAERVAPATLLAEVQRHWAVVAGEVVAREAEPTSERDGTVTISCRSSVWAQELDLLSCELVERLNLALGRDAVRALRCVATPARR
jgi:predicted nucleic acid-binding Zn ribbon protein